jgi:hypothetical protein
MDADGPGNRSPTRHPHTDRQCGSEFTLSPPDARNGLAAPDRGTSESAAVSLVAYLTHPQTRMNLRPADSRRQWMSETPLGFAHRCLPLLIANQSGWVITNPDPISVTWDGSASREGLTIEALDGELPFVSSHFGSALLSWTFPYVFRTSPGYNLLVRVRRTRRRMGSLRSRGSSKPIGWRQPSR